MQYLSEVVKRRDLCNSHSATGAARTDYHMSCLTELVDECPCCTQTITLNAWINCSSYHTMNSLINQLFTRYIIISIILILYKALQNKNMALSMYV